MNSDNTEFDAHSNLSLLRFAGHMITLQLLTDVLLNSV